MKDEMSESSFDSCKKTSSSLKPLSTVGIPWSSRKHFFDKTEFIALVYPYVK